MATKKTHTTKGLKPPKHHSRGDHAKVYWPYLPMLLLLFAFGFLNIWQPLQSTKPATLAYATEMSRSGLLSSTNTQRSANGKASLSLNSKLNAAAQAKANDMVARDYWSHNTPEGDAPWVFIDAQGYDYSKAGENLAYGFDTSSATVTGWMNSPSHKANMLDSAFSEVGFGFADSENFVGTGEETVVVAMYGKPIVQQTVQVEQIEETPQSQPQTYAVTESPEQPKEEIVEEVVEEEFAPVDPSRVNQPVNTDNPVPAAAETTRITLLQQLTGGSAPWLPVVVSLFGFSLAVVWLFKHYIIVRRFVIEGEHFVAHHPILDVIVVSIVALAVYLSQSSGVVL